MITFETETIFLRLSGGRPARRALLPAALAASDIDNALGEALSDLRSTSSAIINPSASTGNYTPEASVTRWEFMRYINRAFDFTEKASISFSDVKSSDTYYETIQIAVKHGYINGMGNNRMDPEGTLTREQAATILGRLHKYAPTAVRVQARCVHRQVQNLLLRDELRRRGGLSGLHQRLH